ncbi:MAG: polysaccharide deacetylase family protein [Thermoplasmata archaeon]
MSYLAITVDVESDSSALADPTLQTNLGITHSLPQLLNSLASRGYPATLFISCDVLDVVEHDLLEATRSEIEIASHGMRHPFPPTYLTSYPVDELAREIALSKTVLKDHLGVEVLGFRAPGLLTNERIMRLTSLSYEYDSSILLFRRYGRHRVRDSTPYHPRESNICGPGWMPITEIPVSSLSIGGLKIPAVGSYIRNLPQVVLRRLSEPVVVLDLHCQDFVRYRNWKYLTADRFLGKLIQLLEYYETQGYRLVNMRTLLREPLL